MVHVFSCLNLPILRQRKYAHVRLARIWLTSKSNNYTKRLYQDHLLSPINVITAELSNEKHQPESHRSATRKIMQERKKLNLLTNSPKFLNDTMIYLKIQTFTTLILILINETLRYSSSGIQKMAIPA